MILRKSKLVTIIILAFILSILLNLIFACFLLNRVGYLLDKSYEEEYDLDLYESGIYKQLCGGDLASEFMPKYDELNGYKKIHFGYYKENIKLSQYSIKSEFMLRLEFLENEEQNYYLQKEKTLYGVEYTEDIIESGYHKVFSTNFFTRKSELISSSGNFDVYYLKNCVEGYPQNVCILLSNDDTLELIYLFYFDSYYKEEYEINFRFFKDFKFDMRFLENKPQDR